MWKNLELLPQPESNKAFILDHFLKDSDFVGKCFDPTKGFSDSYPCADGCGCIKRVVELPDKRLIAVCGESPSRCEDMPIEREDTRILSFNLRKTAGFITEALATPYVVKDIQTVPACMGMIRVGFYTPRGTIKFPIYLHVAFENGERQDALNRLILAKEPFILLLPTQDGLQVGEAAALKTANSMVIGLDRYSDAHGILKPADMLAVLSEFYKSQPDPDPEVDCQLFDTPPGAEWKDITIKFTDGHTVRVTCKGVTGVYGYFQMGMNDSRKAAPNKQWDLLQGFAEERGQFTWENSRANRSQKKQKQSLKAAMQKFFGIFDIDPFDDFKDHKGRICYRSKFNISPED